MEGYYQQIEVPEVLAPYVRRLVLGRKQACLLQSTLAKPTGFNYLGWINEGEIVTKFDTETDIGCAGAIHLSGQLKYEDVSLTYTHPTTHILAEFSTGALYALTGIKGAQIAGKLVRADLRLPNDQWVRAISSADPNANPTNVFISALKVLVEHARPIPTSISRFASMAENSGGTLRVQTIVEQLDMSERHFSEMFTEHVGISPKTFCRILQLNNAIMALMTGDEATLGEIAHRAGFYDQSHFNRSVKDFFQSSPTAFLQSDFGILPDFLNATYIADK